MDRGELRPGQRRLLSVFEGGNRDCVFHPHDPFDMRICAALRERGLLHIYDGQDEACRGGYELTDDGWAALTAKDR